MRPRPLTAIVEAFDLDLLRQPLKRDLTEAGALAVNRDGELRIGDRKQNALLRLAHRWRFQEPRLRLQFEALADGWRAEEQLRIEQIGFGLEDLSQPPTTVPTEKQLERWFEIIEEQGALRLGLPVMAGGILVILNAALDRLYDDLERKPPRWSDDLAPTFEHVVKAAANNFRHSDEWARVGRPSELQLQSMVPLCSALNAGKVPEPPEGWFLAVRRNICCEALLHVSEGSFETLSANLFESAKGILASS